MLTINDLQVMSGRRAARWHGPGQEWSLLEWAGALCGEAGELANITKKIRRLELHMSQDNASSKEAMISDLALEIADVICYAACIANEANIDLDTAVRAKFNNVSERNGFPERI